MLEDLLRSHQCFDQTGDLENEDVQLSCKNTGSLGR
jgi:hypothetical protein